jgi:hypothetical protein
MVDLTKCRDKRFVPTKLIKNARIRCTRGG